MMNDYNSDPLA